MHYSYKWIINNKKKKNKIGINPSTQQIKKNLDNKILFKTKQNRTC